jgi:carbonic anhydrase
MHFSFKTTFLGLSVLVFIAACKGKDEEPLPSCTGITWGYEDTDGPDYWAELCIDYTPCGGQVQSPVNLLGTIYDPTLTDIAQTYNASGTHILNTGHSLQLNYDAGSSVFVDGDTYPLVQFHTHTHSEHALYGREFPMELHFVHKNATTGKIVVIGVFVEEGAENSLLAGFIPYLPATKNGTYDDATATFSALSFMPADKSYFKYAGSLTTPPCSEVVTWVIMEHPITASAAQIASFKMLENVNARPQQALGGRTIQYHKG